MSDVPEPTETLENPWAKRVAEIQRQLAAANERIAEWTERAAVMADNNLTLNAKIAAEREARLKAEDDVTTFKEFWEKTDAARLRAEAGAAIKQEALRIILRHLHVKPDDTVGVWKPIALDELQQAQAALENDTGARLAAVVEEARKLKEVPTTLGIIMNNCTVGGPCQCDRDVGHICQECYAQSRLGDLKRLIEKICCLVDAAGGEP